MLGLSVLLGSAVEEAPIYPMRGMMAVSRISEDALASPCQAGKLRGEDVRKLGAVAVAASSDLSAAPPWTHACETWASKGNSIILLWLGLKGPSCMITVVTAVVGP